MKVRVPKAHWHLACPRLRIDDASAKRRPRTERRRQMVIVGFAAPASVHLMGLCIPADWPQNWRKCNGMKSNLLVSSCCCLSGARCAGATSIRFALKRMCGCSLVILRRDPAMYRLPHLPVTTLSVAVINNCPPQIGSAPASRSRSSSLACRSSKQTGTRTEIRQAETNDG